MKYLSEIPLLFILKTFFPVKFSTQKKSIKSTSPLAHDMKMYLLAF